MVLNADFSQRVLMRAEGATFVPSPSPGVTRRMLDRVGAEVARATSIVRYDAGSRFPEHRHGGGEEFLVLDGVFSDTTGDFGPGAYVRNPPGTSHAPWTEPGCTILVKLHQMDASDRALLRIDTRTHPWAETSSGATMALFMGVGETVHLERWCAGAADCIGDREGLELFVLSGSFQTSAGALAEHDWLRLPPGDTVELNALEDASVWMKRGHLGRHVRGV